MFLLTSVAVGVAQAEVDLTVSADGQVTVAANDGQTLIFGAAQGDAGYVEVPLSAWISSTDDVGNGTGETNDVGNGTGDTYDVGNGTGSTNDVGNGTGDADDVGNGTGETYDVGNGTGDTRDVGNGTGLISPNWGVAEVALGCYEASVIVYSVDADGNLREEDVSIVATEYCHQ